MSGLRVRRARRHRRRLTGGTSALVLAAVVGVVMAAGWGRIGDTEGADGVASRPSSPTRPAVVAPPASPPWRTVRCNRPEDGGCDVPAELVHRGHRYVDSLGGLVRGEVLRIAGLRAPTLTRQRVARPRVAWQ